MIFSSIQECLIYVFVCLYNEVLGCCRYANHVSVCVYVCVIDFILFRTLAVDWWRGLKMSVFLTTNKYII